MIATAEVKARIAGRAEEFVHELFGEAPRREGVSKWRVGKHGSLAIHIKDGALVFYSHEDAEGGDAIALWQQARGVSAGDALKQCASWAGINGSGAPTIRSLPLPKVVAAGADTIAYALSDREISEAMAMVRQLLYDPALFKLRWRGENGARVIRWHFGKPWIWRGAFLRIPDFRRVIITEGETDATRLARRSWRS